jgi:hypothetical protein
MDHPQAVRKFCRLRQNMSESGRSLAIYFRHKRRYRIACNQARKRGRGSSAFRRHSPVPRFRGQGPFKARAPAVRRGNAETQWPIFARPVQSRRPRHPSVFSTVTRDASASNESDALLDPDARLKSSHRNFLQSFSQNGFMNQKQLFLLSSVQVPETYFPLSASIQTKTTMNSQLAIPEVESTFIAKKTATGKSIHESTPIDDGSSSQSPRVRSSQASSLEPKAHGFM